MGVVLNLSDTCLRSKIAVDLALSGLSLPALAGDRADDRIEAGPGARVSATIMLTDIVDSTRRAAAMGDESWSRLLDRHDDLAREIVRRYSGVLAKTTGDGVLATFDGPGCAVRCALTLQSAARLIGLALRVGVHAGEVELRRGDVRGVAVHAAARVMRKCAPGEVLVSRAVADLAAGTGLAFSARGAHELRGLPGQWDLYAARL